MRILLKARFRCFLIVVTTLSLLLPIAYGLDESMFSEKTPETVAQMGPHMVGVNGSIFIPTMFPLLKWARDQQYLPFGFQKDLSVNEDHIPSGHSSPLPVVQHWNTTWNRNVTDGSYAAAVDSLDNIVITGITGDMTYPGQEIDAFVAKYTSSGVLLWENTWNRSVTNYGISVAVDSNDNIIIAGMTGTMTYPMETDAFLAKYSSSGTLLWDTIWNESSTDYSYGVAVDSNDNIIITGATANMTLVQTLVAKYSGSGVLLWEAFGAGFDTDFGLGVAVDSHDNIAITGIGANMTWQSMAAIVAKYSDSGNLLWNTIWNSSVTDYGWGIAVDSYDNIVITGLTGNLWYPNQEADAFIAKYDASGVFLWDNTWDIDETDWGLGVAVDSHDNIVISGITGNLTYPSQEADAFIAKCSGSGALLWGTIWDQNVIDYGLGVAVDSHDNIVISGITGNLTYPSQEADAFIAKFGYVLTVSIYTDKTVYGVGDTMILGLDVANWDDAVNVGFALWIVLPDGSYYVYMYRPSVTLPAKLDYSNPSFETSMLPSITPGIYTWHAALLDPATSSILVEDTAQWQFI